MSAQDFQRQLDAFKQKVAQRAGDVFYGTATALQESIVEGSATTAAPGQPVDLGALKGSWQLTYPEAYLARTATGLEYAKAIEEGQQPPYTRADGTVVSPSAMTLRSEVGGFHSVKLTRAGFRPLVRAVVTEVVGT